MTMFFTHFCAYYFAVVNRYFDCLKMPSWLLRV